MIKKPLPRPYASQKDLSEMRGAASLPALNSAHEVNKIVRKFASDVIKNTFAGDMSREQFVTWITERVQSLSRLFLGEFTMEASVYQRGVWNTPDNLGHYLVEHVPTATHNNNAVTALFNQLGSDVMKIVKNTQLSEQVSKQKLDTVCAEARDLLLGLGIQHHQ
ncbi:MAG: hypothetical protein Q7J51_12910 [Sheuella sp.]|nr:hypothetical protein [Sheuella sp.]